MPPDLDATLAALADPTRRQVVELLRHERLRPSEIAEALALSRPAISRHLRVLRDAGVVVEEVVEEDARARVYELRREPFDDLQGWLGEVEGFWAEQLQGFKAHVERRRGKPRR